MKPSLEQLKAMRGALSMVIHNTEIHFPSVDIQAHRSARDVVDAQIAAEETKGVNVVIADQSEIYPPMRCALCGLTGPDVIDVGGSLHLKGQTYHYECFNSEKKRKDAEKAKAKEWPQVGG